MEDLSEVIPIIAARTPCSLEEVLDYAFRPRADMEPPYRDGRFGDGTFGVYYSALEEETCKEEVAHHLQKDDDASPRSYTMIECRYEGTTANLLGQEKSHAKLVSRTKAGWPFCQKLGCQAIARGLDGFLTASARSHGGTCVPVFSRSALSEPQVGNRYLVTIRRGTANFLKVNP